MVEGGLDGGFWVIYTPQGERTAGRQPGRTRLRPEASGRNPRDGRGQRRQLRNRPDADDAARIKKAGKRIVYISMENASPLASDPSLLSAYYALGLRMLGLVHSVE